MRTAEHHTAYRFGPFSLHPARRLLLHGEHPTPLGSRAFDLLVLLVANAGEVLPATALIESVWANAVVDPASLRVHLSQLKKVLGKIDGGDYVQNVPARGYRFVAPVHCTNVAEPEDQTTSTSSLPVAQAKREAIAPLPTAPLLLGRTTTLEEIAARLQRWRCVTLVGPGGIGKTSVALALSRQLAERFPQGCLFLDLAPVADAAHLSGTLATVLDVPNDPRHPLRGVCQCIAERELLLIVDNCEHLVEAIAPWIESLLGACENLHVLATSREPLRISGETVVRLPPLPLPPVDIQDPLQAHDSPAVQLFAMRARQTHSSFALSADNVGLVAEICRRLDGIPLAIELAAANTATFSLQQIAKHLAQNLSLLVHGRRTALPRHQTLRATIDWGFRLLTPVEQDVLVRLSLFRSHFSQDAAAMVGSPPQAPPAAPPDWLGGCLQSLVSKSMLAVDAVDGSARYRLLDSTRSFAREQLRSRHLFDEAAGQHARYLAGVFDLPADRRQALPARVWVELYGMHLDDLRAAMAWALEYDGAAALALVLLGASAPLWFACGLTAEYLDVAERAAERHPCGLAVPPLALVQFYEALGYARARVQGDASRARDALEHATQLATQFGVTQTMAPIVFHGEEALRSAQREGTPP